MKPEFWMVWIAGMGVPKNMHTTLDSAITEAERLRKERTGREVYVLAPVHKIEGRKLLTIKPTARSCKVQPREA